MIENLSNFIVGAFSNSLLLPPKVSLVCVDLDILHQKIDGCEQEALYYLNTAEQVRFQTFRYGKRKVEWLGGRIAAKCAALQFIMDSREIFWDEKWSRVFIASTDHGKPFLQGTFGGDRNLPGISISHTAGLAMGLACVGNCGVDVQEITPALERVQERFCSEDEQKMMVEIAGRYNRLTSLALLWSAKEAVKKAAAVQTTPGFMEISLRSITCTDNGYLFYMEVPVQDESRKDRAAVWVCLWQDSSFAMTVL